MEADGTLDEITGLGSLADKYRAFGWRVVEIDGHDIEGIKAAFDALPPADSEQPTVFLCHTIKGKGVSFMENQMRWHAGKVSDEQYAQALNDIQRGKGEKLWQV